MFIVIAMKCDINSFIRFLEFLRMYSLFVVLFQYLFSNTLPIQVSNSNAFNTIHLTPVVRCVFTIPVKNSLFCIVLVFLFSKLSEESIKYFNICT